MFNFIKNLFCREKEIKFIKTHPEAVLPSQRMDDIGFDLYSVEDKILEPLTPTLIDTGIALAENPKLSRRFSILSKVENRSGMSMKGMFVGAGIIDPSFRNSFKVLLNNICKESYEIKKGDRVAQLVFYPVFANNKHNTIKIVFVDKQDETERGIEGFGSTGR